MSDDTYNAARRPTTPGKPADPYTPSITVERYMTTFNDNASRQEVIQRMINKLQQGQDSELAQYLVDETDLQYN